MKARTSHLAIAPPTPRIGCYVGSKQWLQQQEQEPSAVGNDTSSASPRQLVVLPASQLTPPTDIMQLLTAVAGGCTQTVGASHFQ